MAENSRGQESRRGENNSHNKVSSGNPRQPQSGSNFEGMNYEQRRRPYNFSERSVNSEFEDRDGEKNLGRRRDVP